MTRSGVAREGVDGGETGVARRSAVVSVGFEVVEEREDVVNTEVVEIEIDDRALATRCDESQKEYERVPVAAHGVWAHAADPGQVIGEEATQSTGERIGKGGTHWSPPVPEPAERMSWQCRVNRRLAASAIGSTKAR